MSSSSSVLRKKPMFVFCKKSCVWPKEPQLARLRIRRMHIGICSLHLDYVLLCVSLLRKELTTMCFLTSLLRKRLCVFYDTAACECVCVQDADTCACACAACKWTVFFDVSFAKETKFFLTSLLRKSLEQNSRNVVRVCTRHIHMCMWMCSLYVDYV